jgi:hypothetical protein
MRKPNTDLEFRHKETGCGTKILVNMSVEDIKSLKSALSLPGLDIEVTALAYPYLTHPTKGER